jgi:hypothetical protein
MGGLLLLVALRIANPQNPCIEESYAAIVDAVVPTLGPSMLTSPKTRAALSGAQLGSECSACLATATKEEGKNVLALFEACTGT